MESSSRNLPMNDRARRCTVTLLKSALESSWDPRRLSDNLVGEVSTQFRSGRYRSDCTFAVCHPCPCLRTPYSDLNSMRVCALLDTSLPLSLTLKVVSDRNPPNVVSFLPTGSYHAVPRLYPLYTHVADHKCCGPHMSKWYVPFLCALMVLPDI